MLGRGGWRLGTAAGVWVVACGVLFPLTVLVAPSAGASGILPPANPAANVTSPNWPTDRSVCGTGWNGSAACLAQELTMVDYGRSLEGLPQLSLPSDWYQMSPA